MSPPQPSQHTVAWEVSTLLLQIVCAGSTTVRLVHRWRTRRMWWDDWIVFIPLSVDVFLVVIDWLAATAVALYIPNVLMPIFECENQLVKWYRMPLIDCVKNRPAPSAAVFTSLALDFVADILLIVTPLTMLWKIKLPKRERTLILTLFSSSILSLFASTAFCIVWALNARFGAQSRMVIRMVGQIEAAIALLVSNLVVVTMMFYCILTRETISAEDKEASPRTVCSLPTTSQTEGTGGTSQKESYTNVATEKAKPNEAPESVESQTTSSSEQDSTTDISFTTIFEDSIQNSSMFCDSYSKSYGTRSQFSGMYEEDGYSCGSSDSRFPAWSFSTKSAKSS
ncbi:hypothetical protein JR316_0002550 [Psilocybe cubensis]|uniref:Rhodopsin domain-containing protein n=2 Tax=Psilocybe cubensis TaxID=181762 RepID=A0A8H7Y575_PSICU|nr:hypothetical protein JR316_0002550 [Psilocybe cubensis]KAH9485640.1 hypothetical protein JR316_0002550 [Psilocybe cubensis]